MSAETKEDFLLTDGKVSVDLSMVYDVTANDESYVIKMVETFLATMPATINTIEDAVKGSDWNQTYLTAHRAKSSLQIIKVTDMLETALAIELNAKKQSNTQAIPALLQKLKANFATAQQLLSKKYNLQ